MKMNTIIKILIGVSLVFSIASFFLMAFHIIDVSATDISTIALSIMSPEVFVGISKIIENTKKTTETNLEATNDKSQNVKENSDETSNNVAN